MVIVTKFQKLQVAVPTFFCKIIFTVKNYESVLKTNFKSKNGDIKQTLWKKHALSYEANINPFIQNLLVLAFKNGAVSHTGDYGQQ